jgi:uncharacterized protein YjbJ (UPF0337 family)
MDKDRIKGAAKQTKGSIKEAVGKITGDTRTKREGALEKAAGETKARLVESTAPATQQGSKAFG